MSGFLVFFAVIAGLILTIILINNSIIQKHNRVRQAWADVITQERQKTQIIPKIESLVKDHKDYESSILASITEMRSAASKLGSHAENVSQTELKSFQDNFQTALKGFNAVVENYPDLKSIGLYRDLAHEISEQEDNIGAAIRIYNSNVATFNTSIEVFPNSLINNLMTKRNPAQPFDHQQSANDIGFTPTF
ncbi:LemA family protein [Providencia rettgeri]|uniref:LemA family protein n=1 Tax=Providencia rettgeri TaxID=587 RepID=UPI0034E0BCD3